MRTALFWAITQRAVRNRPFLKNRVPLPGVKQPGRGTQCPPISSAEVKERVELYLYSTCASQWHVIGRNLPLLGVRVGLVEALRYKREGRGIDS